MKEKLLRLHSEVCVGRCGGGREMPLMERFWESLWMIPFDSRIVGEARFG